MVATADAYIESPYKVDGVVIETNLSVGLVDDIAISTIGRADSIAGTTPNHSTITLDNADSFAVKTFGTLCTLDDGSKGIQWFKKDIRWDVGATNKTLKHITAGTGFTATIGQVYIIQGFTNSDLNGKAVMFLEDKAVTWNSTAFDSYVIKDRKLYYSDLFTVFPIIEVWNGTGFDDNNEFNDLSESYITRLNKY